MAVGETRYQRGLRLVADLLGMQAGLVYRVHLRVCVSSVGSCAEAELALTLAADPIYAVIAGGSSRCADTRPLVAHPDEFLLDPYEVSAHPNEVMTHPDKVLHHLKRF